MTREQELEQALDLAADALEHFSVYGKLDEIARLALKRAGERARAALQPRLDTQKVDFEGVQPGPEAKVDPADSTIMLPLKQVVEAFQQARRRAGTECMWVERLAAELGVVLPKEP